MEAARPLTILRRYAVRVRSLLIDLIKLLGVLGAMGIIPDQGVGAHTGRRPVLCEHYRRLYP